MLKQAKLSQIPVGKNFTVWDEEFTVLKQAEDKIFVLGTRCAAKMPFKEGSQESEVAYNDFRKYYEKLDVRPALNLNPNLIVTYETECENENAEENVKSDKQAESMKHCHWIDRTEWFGSIDRCYYQCSGCGKYINYEPNSGDEDVVGKDNYCRNCGAKMDENVSMKTYRFTAMPYATQSGSIRVPDGINVDANYINEHLSEVKFTQPHLDYNGTDYEDIYVDEET